MLAFGSVQAQMYEDEESAERQKVSVGLFAGTNASGMMVQMPDKEFDASVGVGAELALFTEYHINKTWGIRLVVAPAFERMGWINALGTQHTMRAATLDIVLPLTFRLPAGWFFGLGPCSRFVLGGSMSDGSQLPYTLQVGQDSITGEPRFAVDKFGSGFAVLAGYETPRGWIMQAEVRMGLTNILNTETYRGRIMPYKAVLTAGYRF